MRRLGFLVTAFLLTALAPLAACLAEGTAHPDAPGNAAVDSTPVATADAAPSAGYPRRNAVMVFVGRLSTTDMASTAIFNLNYTPEQGKPSYDNDIVGVEYERDLHDFPHDLHLRAEGGLAERFGHYLVCCLQVPDSMVYPDLTQRLNGRVWSTEAWFGPKIRWDNFQPLEGIRVEFALTVGMSAVTRTIGRERQREIDYQGNAHFIGYVAPEVGMSLDRLRNFELVLRIQHRSGAAGTFGHMREAYNANTLGVRYIF